MERQTSITSVEHLVITWDKCLSPHSLCMHMDVHIQYTLLVLLFTTDALHNYFPTSSAWRHQFSECSVVIRSRCEFS